MCCGLPTETQGLKPGATCCRRSAARTMWQRTEMNTDKEICFRCVSIGNGIAWFVSSSIRLTCSSVFICVHLCSSVANHLLHLWLINQII